ncbi:MAG: hypothetical protein Q8L88_02335 [Bacteroidota bacterium]|nr:hypothetical protein [Bacteroidota bacterium]
MNKTFLELATDAATAMVSKGMIKYVPKKGETWEEINKQSIKTFGWAVVELYKEISLATAKAKLPEKPKAGEKKIISLSAK